VDVDEPQIAKAFEMRKTSESGISLTLDDIPNLVVYDLMKIIEDEKNRRIKKKQKQMKQNTGRMTNRL